MPLALQTAPIGQNFNGTAGLGLVAFTQLQAGDDTQRAEIFSVGVQSPSDIKTSIWVRLASTIVEANNGPFLELANLENVVGLTLACCHCIVPAGWSLFVVTAGPTTAAAELSVDWRRVTLGSRV